ncbi:MAG: hypothetical protein AAB539_03720 [Patescibacteria group bacterium]
MNQSNVIKEIFEKKLRVLRSPVVVTLGANIAGAAVSMISAIIVARWLGVETYGVMAIIWGINATALNLVDVRLIDLMLQWYYRPPPQGTNQLNYQTTVLQVTQLGYLILGVAFFAIGLAANIGLAHLFTSYSIRWQWAAINAMALALDYTMAPLKMMQRMHGRFILLGIVNTASAILSSAVLLFFLYRQRDLGGFYTGTAYGALLAYISTAAILLWILIKHDRMPIFSRLEPKNISYLKQGIGFLWWGNISGHIKMAHRASDILLVGFLTNDQITGVYKLARSFADKLYLVFDALNQIYQPVLMRLLHSSSMAEFRNRARRLILYGAFLTASFLLAVALGYPILEQFILARTVPGLQMAIVILTLSFFTATGFWLWMWPIIIHFHLARAYTARSILAIFIQYSIGFLLYLIGASATAFALGYLAYDIVLMGSAAILLWRYYPEWMPYRQEVKYAAASPAALHPERAKRVKG